MGLILTVSFLEFLTESIESLPLNSRVANYCEARPGYSCLQPASHECLWDWDCCSSNSLAHSNLSAVLHILCKFQTFCRHLGNVFLTSQFHCFCFSGLTTRWAVCSGRPSEWVTQKQRSWITDTWAPTDTSLTPIPTIFRWLKLWGKQVSKLNTGLSASTAKSLSYYGFFLQSLGRYISWEKVNPHIFFCTFQVRFVLGLHRWCCCCAAEYVNSNDEQFISRNLRKMLFTSCILQILIFR